MRADRKIALIVALVVVAASFVGALIPRRSTQAQFTTVRVVRRDLGQAVHATGTLHPISVVHVGALVSGYISATFAEPGDKVVAEQILARIDSRDYRLQMARAEAALRAAQIQVEEASASAQRQRVLRQSGYVSQFALETAERQYQAAVESRTVARTERDVAILNVERCTIRAPMAGVVLSRDASAGQSVTSAFQVPDIFTIVSGLEVLELVSAFAEADISHIKINDAATVKVIALPDEQYDATVIRVLNTPETSQGIVMFPVVLRIQNRAAQLRPGMTADVSIVVEKTKGAMTVPVQALRYARHKAKEDRTPAVGATLYLLENGKIRPVSIRVGITDGTYSQVFAEGPELDNADVVVAELQK
jgi:HlyD family secretion protein